jgi:flagellar hook-length control protein FliK
MAPPRDAAALASLWTAPLANKLPQPRADDLTSDALTPAGTAPTPVVSPNAPVPPADSASATVAEQVATVVVEHLPAPGASAPVVLHLDLRPAELGRVRVQVTAREHDLDIRVVVQNGTAQHLLQNQVESLRTRLGELGIALCHFDVQRDGSQSFGQQQHEPAPTPAPAPLKPVPQLATAPSVRAASTRAGIDLLA